MSIKVLIADDHEIVRKGIISVIASEADDIQVVAEAADGNEVLRIAESNQVDIYVIDIAMPNLNGIDAAARLRTIAPKSKIIFLTMYDRKSLVEKALQCGAKGYLLKESAVQEIVQCIREVYRNKMYVSSIIATFLKKEFSGKKYNYEQCKSTASLTKREKEILQLIAEGYSNKDMADNLNLSLNTIHVHRNNIMQKLNIHKETALVRYALKEEISFL